MLNSEFDTTFFKFPFTEAHLKKGAFSASTGITYRIKKLQFNFNLASGFRAPNIDDIGKVFDSEPGSVVVPNPDLSPEYIYSAELGLIKRGEFLHLELNGFYSYLDNAMVRRDYSFNGLDSIIYDGTMSKVQAFVNTDNALIYGVQGIVSVNLYDFEIKSSLSYTSGEDNEGYSLRYAPPLFGATHLIYDAYNLKLDVNYNYNGEITSAKLTPTEIAKPEIYAKDNDGNPYCPAWQNLNFKASYQFTFANKNLIDLYFGIENILDVRYRPYSSGIVSPGRNFIFGLKYNFDSTK
jgi:hemoglobin/transferrin/lactoferrin receptor protein